MFHRGESERFPLWQLVVFQIQYDSRGVLLGISFPPEWNPKKLTGQSETSSPLARGSAALNKWWLEPTKGLPKFADVIPSLNISIYQVLLNNIPRRLTWEIWRRCCYHSPVPFRTRSLRALAITKERANEANRGGFLERIKSGEEVLLLSIIKAAFVMLSSGESELVTHLAFFHLDETYEGNKKSPAAVRF